MGAGGEFDLIRAMLARWGPAARGIGDDAALLDIPRDMRLVATVDCAVEGVHFRRDWLTPREIGYRAAAAAASDLAAMAASPVALLLALAIPANWIDALGDVADGIGDLATATGLIIAGGNISRAPAFSITTTALGTVRDPLERSGVSPGDRLYVTGVFGGPAAAIRALDRGAVPDETHRARLAHPVPRLREAQWLARHGATAAIDISDGLLADAGHLASASAVTLSFDLDGLPVVAGVNAAEAAAGGEEYELLVSSGTALDAGSFAAEFGIPLTEIGEARAGAAGVQATVAGRRVAHAGGHDHFSG